MVQPLPCPATPHLSDPARLVRSPAAPPDPPLQTLFRLQKVKESSWFWAPVKAEDAPGYFDVVRRPMDLATISDKVRGVLGHRVEGGLVSGKRGLC